jgi:hypothetical protein
MDLLTSLKKLFASNRAGKPRCSSQLMLESLDERIVPAVTYHGGPLIANVHIEAVYEGTQWGGQDLTTMRGQLDGYLQYVTNSPYMDLLKEYSAPGYDIGHGSFVGERVIDTTLSLGPIQINTLAAGTTVDDCAIQKMLQTNITNGTLAAPNANNFYFVFTPPNVKVTRGSGDSVKTFFAYHDSFVDSAGKNVYYAVIAHQQGNGTPITGLSAFQQATETSSHELAEAITDPNLTSGWRDYSVGNTTSGMEIGDICNLKFSTLNGFTVQKEWSNLMFDQVGNGCVLLQSANFSAYAMTQNGNFFELAPDGHLWWRDVNDHWRLSDSSVTAMGVTGNTIWDLRTDHSLNYSVGYDSNSWITADSNVASFQITGSNPWDIRDTHTDGSTYHDDGAIFVADNWTPPPPRQQPPGHNPPQPPPRPPI